MGGERGARGERCCAAPPLTGSGERGAVSCCRPSGLLRALGRQLSPWAGRRSVPFGHPIRKVNYARRVNCQTSQSFSVVSSRFLPSFPCGLRAGERRRGAARGDEVTGGALLTYSQPPSAYLLLPPVPSSPAYVEPSRSALSQRPRPPPTDARQARRPARRNSGPRVPLRTPLLAWREARDPPGIDWIGFSFFLVRRPNLTCF